MGVLDQINEMKNKGFSEQQIVNKLEEQEGVSPKEISDAMSRSKIKEAVSSGGKAEGMQPSIMAPEKKPEADDYNYGLQAPTPSYKSQKGFQQTQEISSDYQPQEQEEYAPQQQYQNQEYAPQQDYYSQTGYATDTDTMIEIAEQVFSEKMKNILKKIEEVLEFKTLSEAKLENVSDRLKRMESQIDKLQSAILEEVGSYGRGLESVKREMGMMQESFGKVVNTLTDKAEHKHHHKHHTPTATHKIKKKTTRVIRHKSSKNSKSKKSKKKTSKKK